jgi:galactonate dehydratase
MRITAVEPAVVHVNHRGDWVFVLVRTDAGLTGLGEASHSGNDALLMEALAGYAARLKGEDPLCINAIRAWAGKGELGRVRRTAWSGIEQALWDLLGQSLQVPIRTLFGGAVRDRIRLYANINRHVQDRSPEGFAFAAQSAVSQGFAGVKLAPFDEVAGSTRRRTGSHAAWQPGVARVRAVREAIGPAVELMVDCHGRFDAAEAVRVAEALAGVDLLWFEEPVPDSQIDALARVTAEVSTATASGENLYGVEAYGPFLTRRVVDVLMPDVKHDGGLLDTKIISESACMSGLQIAPHNPSGPVSTAATAQVASTLVDLMHLEYAWGEADWRAELLDPPERIEDGHLILPDGPGLGHRLNDQVLKAHRQAVISSADSSRVRPL